MTISDESSPSLTVDGITISLTSLAASPEGVEACAHLLSTDERARADRFRFDRDRRRFIVCRAALRRRLATRLGTRPADVRFAYGPFGKPRLADEGRGVRFNVSHSGDWAVIAITEGAEVGVDIEQVEPLDDMEWIAAQVFSPREQRVLRTAPEADRLEYFYAGWTRKEAFVKARGNGLQQRLDAFDVELAPGEPARLIEVRDEPEGALRWRIRSLDLVPGFAAALCVAQGSPFGAALRTPF